MLKYSRLLPVQEKRLNDKEVTIRDVGVKIYLNRPRKLLQKINTNRVRKNR
jgi:hypothetical protein